MNAALRCIRTDFSPKHGGKTFSAPNGYHHFEAVYVRPRTLKIYLYDAFGHSIQAAYFQGAVSFRGEKGRGPTPLRISDDGTLETLLPAKSFPLILDAKITYGGPVNGPKPFDHVFDVRFDHPTGTPDGTTAKVTSDR